MSAFARKRRTASHARAARTIGRNSSGEPAPPDASSAASSGREVLEAAEGQPSVADAEADGLVRLREQAADLGLLGGGRQRQNRRPSGRRSGQGGNETEDDAELEGFPVGAVSVRRVYGVARFSSESLRSIFLRAWIILRLRLALGFS